jgi:hypothetical protein
MFAESDLVSFNITVPTSLLFCAKDIEVGVTVSSYDVRCTGVTTDIFHVIKNPSPKDKATF